MEGAQMTIIVENLDEHAWRHLSALCEGLFLEGECFAFAIALHRNIGWPIVGVMNGDEVRHAGVVNPVGDFHDARGPVQRWEIGLPFSLEPPFRLNALEPADLLEIRPVSDLSIGRALKIAQVLWPELPWISGFRKKAEGFAKDLERISRRHGIWLRSPVPAYAPMLAEGDDSEDGYTMVPTHDGSTYSIDRRFK